METSESMHHTTPPLYWITEEKILLEKIEFLKSKVSFFFRNHLTLIKYTAADILLHSEYIFFLYVFMCPYLLCEHLLCVGGCAFEHG